MKKIKLLLKFLLVFAIAASVVSCSEKKGDALNSIPADSKFVAIVNLKTVIEKGKLDDITKYSFFDKVYPKLEQEDEAVAKFVKGVCKDPKQTGIDLNSKMAFFLNGSNLKKPTGGMVVGMSDAAKFETFIGEVLKQGKEEFEIVEKDGYKTLVVNKMKDEKFAVIAWSNDRLLIHGSSEKEDVTGETAKLFAQKSDESLLGNSDFTEFMDRKSDQGLWISYGDLMNSLSDEMAMVNQLGIIDLTDTYLHIVTNFEKGEIVTNTIMNLGPKMKDLAEKYAPVKTKIDSDILDYLPKKSMIAFTAALDFEKSMEYIKSQPTLKAYFDQAAQAASQMPGGRSLEDIVKTFGGDIAISVSGVNMIQVPGWDGQMRDQPMPEATMVISLNDKSFLDDMKKMGAQMMQEEDGVSIFQFQGMSAYGVLKDDALVITSSKEVATKAVSGGYGSDGLAENGVRKAAESSSSMMFVNLALDTYPDAVKQLMQSSLGRNYSNVESALASFSKVLITSKSYNEGVIKVEFSSDDENSLYMLINNMSEEALKNMPL